MPDPYNPLDKTNLAESIVAEFLRQPGREFSEVGELAGHGVYALYYRGPFAPYAPIRATEVGAHDASPIYVGKAVPEGRRTATESGSATGNLRGRLNTHRRSITAAANLELTDFWFRALAVDDVWINLAETMLIARFRPLWNTTVDGFGNNAPGGGRANQRRSPWDQLHPGRGWAANLPEGESVANIEERIAARFGQ